MIDYKTVANYWHRVNGELEGAVMAESSRHIPRHAARNRLIDSRALRGVGHHPDACQHGPRDGLHLRGIEDPCLIGGQVIPIVNAGGEANRRISALEERSGVGARVEELAFRRVVRAIKRSLR